MISDNYKNVFGIWTVTTEGDVEGKSIKYLGTYTGYVDEIALHLADKCYYSLTFKKIESVKKFIPKSDSVNVKFDINSGTWSSVHTSHGLAEIRNIFADRPVSIKKGRYYASFLIKSNNADDIKRQKALSKLSDEEKRLLNLM
jgi:hypothetical protein